MECDLQAKKYSDSNRCSFKNVSPKIMEDTRVKEIISNGAKTVADVFIEYDKPKYAQNAIFSDMINFLKEYSIN